MKANKIILFMALVFSWTVVSAQEIGRELYIDKVNDYMISYPDDWSLEEGQEGEITLYPPFGEEYSEDEIDSESDDEIIEEKLQIIPSRWDEGSLEEYIDVNFHSIDWSEFFVDFRIDKQGDEKINEKEAIWFLTKYYIGDTPCVSYFYFIKMFNKVVSFTSFCKEEDFELDYKIKYLEIIRSTRSYLETKR
ncbi:MAG: hypothetical protein WCR29_00235 [Bacteroidales bacterium]|nr:hypothetical protein [Bacteroidales bacterium]